MKLGVLTNVIGDTPLKEALAYFKGLGIQMVEIGCGGYPGKDHCDPGVLLHDEAKFNEFVKTIEESGLQISALSCHGNPVHPNKEIAKQFDDDMHNARGDVADEAHGGNDGRREHGCPGGELIVQQAGEIIFEGVRYLRIEGAFYCGIGCLFLLYGLYRALGKPGMSVVLTVISLGTRVALAYILSI